MRLTKNPIRISVWILTVLSLLAGIRLAAQSPAPFQKRAEVRFEHFGEEQGVNSQITCIFEDHLGYLWFGSAHGLYRFNGYEYDHYEYIVDDTTSLPHNIVANILHEDRSGNLWLFSGGQIARYNRATNDFSRFTYAMRQMGYNTWVRITSLTEDQDGNIWLGSLGNPEKPHWGGLVMMDPESEQIIHFQHDPSDSSSIISNCVSRVFVDSEGNLWVGTMKGLDRFVPDSEQGKGWFVHYRPNFEDHSTSIRTYFNGVIEDTESIWYGTNNGILRYLKNKDILRKYWINQDPGDLKNRVTGLSRDQYGQIWIETRDGMGRYNPPSDDFIIWQHDPDDPFSISQGHVRAMEHGKDGSIWTIIGEEGQSTGITRFDPGEGKFQLYGYQKSDPNSLSSNLLTSVLEDRNGILWIGSANAGINKYDPNQRKFSQLPFHPFQGENVPPENIFAICEDQLDRIWIGTRRSGLFCYDRRSGNTIHYDPKNPHSPKSSWIFSIIEGSAGILWIGGDSGLNRLDTRTMEFDHYWIDKNRNDYFGPNFIRDLYPGSNGNLWIATMGGGLFSFDIDTRTFKSHMESQVNPGGVPTYGLMSVLEDKNGIVWVGSMGGLHKYYPENEDQPARNIHYIHQTQNPMSIGANMVGDMVRDKSGNLWVATGGGGLNKLDIESGEFTRYTTSDGLISNSITNVTMDGQGKLWLGSFDGWGIFDPLTEKCITYDRSDGLHTREINQGTAFRNSQGEILFAAAGGINYFHPDSLTMNQSIPTVVLSGMYLFDEPQAMGMNKVVELKHDENFISFEFAALNFTNSHKNEYRYRMIGLDPDTVFAGTRRIAAYTGIKPGKYTFWVTGSNNDGIWNTEGTSLDILIHPPWWRSDLLIGLYVILFIAGVLGFIRWRTWKLVNDRKILEKLVKERTRVIEEKDRHILEMDRMKTRFFANISHEFRTPITLILSPLEDIIARRTPADPDIKKLGIIRRNGHRLLDLVNQLLDLSKLDSGKLKLELVNADVVKSLRLICASFISLAEKSRIKYSFRIHEREWITFFDAGKLETILNNLLSNAFKHTPKDGIIDCYAMIARNGDQSGEDPGPEKLTISVIDSGKGIDPNELDLIFDRFYQVDDQHHIESAGTGIGLSLTKELVELIHGEITVNSEPGEGSCFTVTLPLGKEHLRESEYIIKEESVSEKVHAEAQIPGSIKHGETLAESGETEDLPRKGPIHLLIVEDNEDLRSYLREQLQNDYTIVEATEGEEGLKKALRIIPDLIITDVMMPGMDGTELCKRLKTNERTSHIPVIMLTARADFESKITGLETGADEYILKPFQIRELRVRIKNLIHQRNMLRERYGGSVDTIAEDITLNSYDVRFIRRITEVVENHLSDFEFDVNMLQGKSGMSPTQLYRKLQALTGLSPSRFVRHMRLKRAVKMLEQKKGSITHVAFEVGFGNLSYFTKCFKEEFGISPSEYSRQYV